MTDKEKAEAYDEAIKKAESLYKVAEPMSGCNVIIETLFPELAESEDEKMRKEIIDFLKLPHPQFVGKRDHEKWITWLEKQGENCLVNFDEAEKEKYDFVSGQFIECRKSFNGFKEDNSYWLEYVGDDNYIGRSDNILNQKFHITPRQLFTLFTWQHRPKENNVNEETNAPTGYGKYVDECLNEASKHFFSEGEDKYSVADLFYAGVRCGKSWLENQSEQKSAWSEEDERMLHTIIADFKGFIRDNTSTLESHFNECIDWLKSLRPQPKQEWSEEEIEKAAQEWESKANFNPFYMTMEGDKPTGVKQHITTHKESFKAGVNWVLNSLKGRVHSQWKPTDKQMNVLWYHCSDGSILKSLYNDLKKLKEE